MLPSVVRCLGVWAGTTCSSLVAGWIVRDPIGECVRSIADGTARSTPLDELLAWLCSVTLAACVAWWWLTATVLIVSAARRT
ncbi:MAG: hypothetical protein ACRCYQ_02130, partial [Nocardioides sp.]